MFGLQWYHYMLITVVSANILFLGIGGLIHYLHYHKKRHLDTQWKMQPGKYLSDKMAKHAVFWGTLNMNIASAAFGFLGWGVLEHGWSQIYFDFNDYSLAWAALSVFLAFLFIEASAYYIHAGIHQPFLYKHIHQMHHYYTAPTFFTISAMHPLEWIIHASYVIAPAFLFPMHWSLYLFVMMTTFFYGFWDHAGIKLKHNLPFHGCNQFHDDHHKYFHVNFGFLTPIFDRIHNTVRREGHHYTELTFQGGQGRVKLDELGDKAIGPWVDYSSSWAEKEHNNNN